MAGEACRRKREMDDPVTLCLKSGSGVLNAGDDLTSFFSFIPRCLQLAGP